MNARAPIRSDLRVPSTTAARARALSTFVSSFKGAGMLGMLEWWHSRFRDSSGTRAIPTQARRAAGCRPGVSAELDRRWAFAYIASAFRARIALDTRLGKEGAHDCHCSCIPPPRRHRPAVLTFAGCLGWRRQRLANRRTSTRARQLRLERRAPAAIL